MLNLCRKLQHLLGKFFVQPTSRPWETYNKRSILCVFNHCNHPHSRILFLKSVVLFYVISTTLDLSCVNVTGYSIVASFSYIGLVSLPPLSIALELCIFYMTMLFHTYSPLMMWQTHLTYNLESRFCNSMAEFKHA